MAMCKSWNILCVHAKFLVLTAKGHKDFTGLFFFLRVIAVVYFTVCECHVTLMFHRFNEECKTK